jgi:3-hydroxyisobutyrate dehydrogenase
MLPTSEHVSRVVAEARPALAPGAVVVEMSSGVPSVTRALAGELAGDGVALVDCPVSGGVPRAVTGDLAIMAGGDDDALARVEPLLAAMGSSVHRCGGVGTGQAMKALNNLVSAGGFLVGIEALLIGQRAGLEPDRMIEVLNASSGTNNSTQRKFGPFVLSRAFDSGFGLDLMVKDLGIAVQMAREDGVAAPFSALCAELWASAGGLLGPGRDHTEMARFSEAIAGAELG